MTAETLTVPHIHLAEIIRWVDGDTVYLMVDHDYRIYSKQPCRLLGVDTPEAGKLGYKEAKAFCNDYVQPGSTVRATSEPGPDKYGRFLVKIEFLHQGKIFVINVMLLEAGLAKPYSGGKK